MQRPSNPARNRNERQFDEYRDWQWCKHLALGDYIVPWSMKVGSTAREIFVIDAFAGAGSYTDPTTGIRISDGSPVIFARRARTYREQRPGRSVHVICVEKNRKNYAALEQRMRGFSDVATTMKGDFAAHTDAILERIGNAPALVLLDPIGLKTIKAEAWKPFLDRPGKTDLFIVLHFGVVHRIGGMLLPTGHANLDKPGALQAAASLDDVFNGPRWRYTAVHPNLVGEQHREERERRYVDLFFDDVIGKRHRWKCAFPVRARFTSPLVYWLVHASDNIDAFLLMNDEIVKLDELLFVRTFERESELDGFTEAELEARRNVVQTELEAAVVACVARTPGQSIAFSRVREELLPAFFGRVKQGAYAKAVKNLVKTGRLHRQERPAARLEDHELISLPPSGPGTSVAVRGKVIPFRAA